MAARKSAKVAAKYTTPSKPALRAFKPLPACCDPASPRFGEHRMVPWGDDARYAVCFYRCGLYTRDGRPARKPRAKPRAAWDGPSLWAGVPMLQIG